MLGYALAGLLTLLLVAGGAAALWLGRADLKPLAERVASEALGRRVTLDRLAVRWGDPLGIEIAGLAIANASWGAAGEMVLIGRLTARIALGSLLAGEPRYERLRIADAAIALERDRHGTGNWQFGPGASGLVPVPTDRAGFPTLIDFVAERGVVTYRAGAGATQRIRLDRVAIAAPDEEAPVRLRAHGAYNAVAARLDATTGSYAALRDPAEPLAARFTLRSGETDLAFDGRIWEPLEFDGVRGELSVDASSLSDMLEILGLPAGVDLPLSAAGILRRDGDRWSIESAKGLLQRSAFSGSLDLAEGGRGAPDQLALDLDFSTLDLDSLAAALHRPGPAGALDAVPLAPPAAEGLVVTASLSALRAAIGGRLLHAILVRGQLAESGLTLEELSLALGGGTLSVAGSLGRDGAARRLELRARLAKANVAALARELALPAYGLHGRLNGAAVLSMAGGTVGEALAGSSGGAVITLSRGAIADGLIERLSGDLRRLLGSGQGGVPVSCLLGIVTLEDGTGVLSPLRLESGEAVAIGAGTFSLASGQLDLIIRAERGGAGAVARDAPVRISGPLDRLRAEPLTEGDPAQHLKARVGNPLPSELGRIATGDACRD